MGDLTDEEWLYEINARLTAYTSLTGEDIVYDEYFENLIPSINDYQTVFNKVGKQRALETIALIKKHGLISPIKLPILKQSRPPENEWGRIYKETLSKAQTIKHLKINDVLYINAIIKSPEWRFPNLLEVDLDASPDRIKKEFNTWLDKQMESRSPRLKRDFDTQKKLWASNKVLAYWDLKHIAELDGINISGAEILEKLNYLSSDGAGREARKGGTLYELCQAAFSDETRSELQFFSEKQ